MAGTLGILYSVVVLAVAVLGVAFVFTRRWFAPSEGASGWSRWGELLAVAVFLVAMVATMVLGV